MSKLNSKIPKGPLAGKWTNHKGKINLVSPSNKRNIDVIVVGTGLAGASASATLAELGYNVKSFCFQDSPRRAHSIAAQGGINAAKNYQGDGDSTYRLFYDTIKGGDTLLPIALVERKKMFPYPPDAITTACAECLSISPLTRFLAIIPLALPFTTTISIISCLLYILILPRAICLFIAE